jgi:DNA repair exonuclease SbcCD ATPase subunit
MSTATASPMEAAEQLAQEQFRKSVDDMVECKTVDLSEIMSSFAAVGQSVSEGTAIVRKGQEHHAALADIERASELSQGEPALQSRQSELEAKRQEIIAEFQTKLAEIDAPLAETQGQLLAIQSQAHQLRSSGEQRLQKTTDPAIGERLHELGRKISPLNESIQSAQREIAELESDIEQFPMWRDGSFEIVTQCDSSGAKFDAPRACRYPRWHTKAGLFERPHQLKPRELERAEQRVAVMQSQVEQIKATLADDLQALEPIQAERERVEGLLRDPRAFLAIGLL